MLFFVAILLPPLLQPHLHAPVAQAAILGIVGGDRILRTESCCTAVREAAVFQLPGHGLRPQQGQRDIFRRASLVIGVAVEQDGASGEFWLMQQRHQAVDVVARLIVELDAAALKAEVEVQPLGLMHGEGDHILPDEAHLIGDLLPIFGKGKFNKLLHILIWRLCRGVEKEAA